MENDTFFYFKKINLKYICICMKDKIVFFCNFNKKIENGYMYV